jgi:hypothetical protein
MIHFKEWNKKIIKARRKKWIDIFNKRNGNKQKI